MSENKRIAKNTIYMYMRMFVTMFIGIYVSRTVLAVLGVNDFGLYNVVGGVIAMFSFLNGAMANTTSRYITFYLGKNDLYKLRNVFSTAFYIHIVIALCIVLLGETVGLWYVCNKLVIPEGRFHAAVFVYQFTIIAAAINIVGVPFNSALIAYERMSFFAFIAIADSVMKLIVAISLSYVSSDKLIYYGFLLLLIQLFDNIAYWTCSYMTCEGVRLKRVFDKALFKEIFSFSGWNIFGNFSYIFFSQGINLILNAFCGTAVNAARGIAVQIESIACQFAGNIQTPMNPQIVKSYSNKDKERMFSLIFASSRYCFYLLLLIVVPIFLEAEFLLELWLGKYPEHTVNFLRITLVSVLLSSLATPMFMANLASGKVRKYQIVMCVISLIFIPITYLSIKLTVIPETVFLCTLLMVMVEIVARIFIVHEQVGLPRLLYVRKVLLNIFYVVILSVLLPSVVVYYLPCSLLRLCAVVVTSYLSVLGVVYLVGLNTSEKTYLEKYIKEKLHSWH